MPEFTKQWAQEESGIDQAVLSFTASLLELVRDVQAVWKT
jgi:hypothetical protein